MLDSAKLANMGLLGTKEIFRLRQFFVLAGTTVIAFLTQEYDFSFR